MKKKIAFAFVFIGLVTNSYSQKKYEFGAKLTDYQSYNVQKAMEESKENAKKGLPYSSACFMIDGFQKKYYTGEKISWYEPKDEKQYSRYKGEMTDKLKQKHSISLVWQSYSDGLEWIYYVVELIRNEKKTPSFDIIKDKKLVEKIQNKISFKKKDKIDVFLYQFYYVVTADEFDIKNLVFPEIKEKDLWYGVYYKEQLFLFNEQGEIQEQKKIGWGY